jgi:hypothetical protein
MVNMLVDGDRGGVGIAHVGSVGPDGKSFKRGNIVFRDLALPLKKKEEKKSAIV